MKMSYRTILFLGNITFLQGASAAILTFGAFAFSAATAQQLAVPSASNSAVQTDTVATAVLAGGCFWGIEAVFEHVRGVRNVVSGYAGGDAKTARYELVSLGNTKHAESVRITYDPSELSYTTLLRIFFSVAHDPTQLNRQGPDYGTQYRSAIFFVDEEQRRVAQLFVDQLAKMKVFSKPVVTQIVPLEKFYLAESYHQDFAERNPTHRYIVINDAPKVIQLKKQLPELYRESSALSSR